jgi:anaphase-promoting complex subunit 3
VPNGAAGLALLGKICRKSNRKDRAIKYFRMSLQLDPFLFTSFQALAELGVADMHASSVFGGTTGLQNNLHNQSSQGKGTNFNMKTPLQPMEPLAVGTAPRNGRAFAFETPGLTPINVHNESLLVNQTTPAPSVTVMLAQENPSIVRRARQVASRQYYPPSPETPLTVVTRSMRYLRGLGTNEGGRSLFLTASSENQASNQGPPETTTTTSAVDGNLNLKPDKESDETVQDILDLLTVAGAAYQSLCQYRCREALHQFQQLPISQQRTAWVLQQQGRVFLEQGDFLSAQRCLEFMHAVDPGRMQGLELLSTVYWQLKKEIDLANLAQRAMDWDFESPEAHCVAGNCFSLQKDHETALVFFKRSLQLDPDFTYTHTLSGYEYMSNEDFDKATACFRKALRSDERHYNAWYGLGAIYHRQEKFDLAEYHFDRAVSIHPTSSVLRCNLGMAQNANGKAYVALETLSEAFRLDPRNPQARYQRATIYSALHRPEEALAELKIVRDAAPREATVHFAMGKVLKRLGRPDEAMKCFLTAMDLDPKDNQLIKSAMDKLDEPDADEESMANY